MKKITLVITGVIFVAAMSGCGKHLQVTGNAAGRPDDGSAANRLDNSGAGGKEKDKKIVKVIIDLPPYEYKDPTIDKDLWGNRGVLRKGSYQIVKPLEAEPKQKPPLSTAMIPDKDLLVDERLLETEPLAPVKPGPVTVNKESRGEEESYIVQKNDSLWKIAKKFYGTPNKWRVIYEANRSKISDPNKLKSGQTLLIPKQPAEQKEAGSAGSVYKK